MSLKFLFRMSVVLKVNTFYIFTAQLCNQCILGSDVCRLEMFSFMFTRWCSRYCFYLPTGLFPVQRNFWCLHQDHTTGELVFSSCWKSHSVKKMIISCFFCVYVACFLARNFLFFYILTQELMQEGLARLWRGTNAGLALAVPMVCSFVYICGIRLLG